MMARDYDGEIIFCAHPGMCAALDNFDLKTVSRGIAKWINYTTNWQIDFSKCCRSEVMIGIGPFVETRKALFLVDFFKGLKRSTLESRYGEELVKSMVGMPRDPFTVEKLKLKDEEMSRILFKYKDLTSEKLSQYNKALDAAREQYKADLQRLEQLQRDEIKALEEKFQITVGAE